MVVEHIAAHTTIDKLETRCSDTKLRVELGVDDKGAEDGVGDDAENQAPESQTTRSRRRGSRHHAATKVYADDQATRSIVTSRFANSISGLDMAIDEPITRCWESRWASPGHPDPSPSDEPPPR